MNVSESERQDMFVDADPEIDPARAYFALRTPTFWLCGAIILTVGILTGTIAAFYPEAFNAYLLFEGWDMDESGRAALRLRGTVSLALVTLWFGAFLARLALARYVVYVGTVYVAALFAMDLQNIAFSDNWLKAYLSSGFLVVRPVMLLALVTAAFSFFDTVPYERPLFRRRHTPKSKMRRGTGHR